MDAVYCTDFGEFEIRSAPRPTPDVSAVLVEVDRVQLSVSECKLYRGEGVAHYDTIRERLDQGDGRLFGHEFCGRVVETGTNVSAYEPGDRVYAPGKIPCNACAYCAAGYEHFCENKAGIGFDRPGALAEYVALPTDPLCRLPDEVTDAEGAAMQPLASSLLCTFDAGIAPGDVVAVIGTGVMGYQCGQIARRLGATDVYAIDIRSEPLAVAAENGLEAVDATDTDPTTVVRERTDGIGADVVFEAAGGNQSHATEGDDPLAQAHRMVRNGGTIVQVGHVAGDVAWTPRRTRSKCVNWVNPRKGAIRLGPNAHSGELAAQLAADGHVSPETHVTHELEGLEEFGTAVEITLEKKRYDALGPAQIVIHD